MINQPAETAARSAAKSERAPVWLVTAGLAVVFAEFQGLAHLTGSYRGEFGVLIAVVVVASLFAIERLLFLRRSAETWRFLGLGRPSAKSLVVSGALGAVLLALLPLFAMVLDTSLGISASSAWIVFGLFAQAGIAEETLFRGYLFHHFRISHPFWRAAGASAIPFVAVHLILFASMPWPVAAGATLVSVATSFAFAHLFEMGRFTIWAPAFLHFVIQGAIKLVAVDEAATSQLQLLWIAASALVPFAAFFVTRRPDATNALLRLR